jgi:hypothetical protein
MAIAKRVALEAVKSSNLAAVGYDVDKQILAIQFKNGQIFHYSGVPETVATEFVRSPSLGRYYTQTIRGKFSGALMTGLCEKCGAQGWIGETCEDCGCAVYTEKPRPIVHWVDWETVQSRLRRAACRDLVTTPESTLDEHAVTCPACKAEMKARDAMRF